jgi:hypothetical protein
MERTLPVILQWDENLDIGFDTGTPVDDKDYQVPFKFTGRIIKITFTIDRPKLTREDKKKLREAQRQKSVSEWRDGDRTRRRTGRRGRSDHRRRLPEGQTRGRGRPGQGAGRRSPLSGVRAEPSTGYHGPPDRAFDHQRGDTWHCEYGE